MNRSREWALNLSEREKDRIERQLAAAVEVGRTLHRQRRPWSREPLEPTGIYVQKDVEKIIRRRSA